MKKDATDELVMAFMTALYPDAPNLAIAAFDEAKVLTHAIETLNNLRATNQRLTEKHARLSRDVTYLNAAVDAEQQINRELREEHARLTANSVCCEHAESKHEEYRGEKSRHCLHGFGTPERCQCRGYYPPIRSAAALIAQLEADVSRLTQQHDADLAAEANLRANTLRLTDALDALAARTPYESGACCMARHANAVPPWTCDCPCHAAREPEEPPA